MDSVSTITTDKTIRVLLADDHAIVREGMRSLVSQVAKFEVVGLAADGNEAINLYDRLNPDVVLLDLQMPILNGHAVLEVLSNRNPKPKIIVITTFQGDEDLRRAVRAGAMGYLLKDASIELICETICKVYEGIPVFESTQIMSLTKSLGKPHLTEREQLVLQLIAQGLCNKQIGSKLHISAGTVKTHVHAVMTKLEASSRTEAVIIGAERGLVRIRQ